MTARRPQVERPSMSSVHAREALAKGRGSAQRPSRSGDLGTLVRQVRLEAVALEDRLAELRALHDVDAVRRLALASALWIALGAASYFFLPPWILIVGLPLVAVGLVVAMRLDHVVRWMHRWFGAVGRVAQRVSGREGRWQRFVVRPFLAGLNFIGASTSTIENRYLRAGVGGAATFYYGGGALAAGAAAVAAALLVAYVMFIILVVVAIIAGIIALMND